MPMPAATLSCCRGARPRFWLHAYPEEAGVDAAEPQRPPAGFWFTNGPGQPARDSRSACGRSARICRCPRGREASSRSGLRLSSSIIGVWKTTIGTEGPSEPAGVFRRFWQGRSAVVPKGLIVEADLAQRPGGRPGRGGGRLDAVPSRRSEDLGLAEQGRRAAGGDRLQDRRSRCRHRPRPQGRSAAATMNSPRTRFEFDWNRQFRTVARPGDARAMHDRDAAAGGVQVGDQFCSMCGPEILAR